MKSSSTTCDICQKKWDHIHGGPPPQGMPTDIGRDHWLNLAIHHSPQGLGTPCPGVAHACNVCLMKAANLIQKFVVSEGG